MVAIKDESKETPIPNYYMNTAAEGTGGCCCTTDGREEDE